MRLLDSSQEGMPKSARIFVWSVMVMSFACALVFGHSAFSIMTSMPLSTLSSSANPAAYGAVEKADDERTMHLMHLIQISAISFATSVGLHVALWFDERRRRRTGTRGFPLDASPLRVITPG